MKTELFRAEGHPHRPKRYALIKSSEVIKVSDWITNEGVGVANVDAKTEKVLGYATAIVTPDKRSFESPSVDTGAFTGTWVSSTKTYTASSTNDDAGGDGVMVEFVEVREGDRFKATLDAAKTTTVASGIIEGYFAGILTSDSSKLDESDLTTAATGLQFKVVDRYSQGATTEVIVEVVLRDGNQQAASV
jgi:hypothetical protein